MNKRYLNVLIAFMAFIFCAVQAQNAEKPKLILERITYEKPEYKIMLEGGDQLLLEKLVHAQKYSVMDRGALDVYLREKGIQGNEGAGLAAGDRALFAHFIDCTKTQKSKILPGNKIAFEYIVRMSLKICKMEETLTVETIENERIEAFCISKVDLIDVVMSRLARRAVFAVAFARPEIADIDDRQVEVNYGKGFLFPGEVYEICTGAKGIRGLKSIGKIKITEVDKDFSAATILEGTVNIGNKLKLVESANVIENPGNEQGLVTGGRITCAVSHFGFASDFKGAGYKKKKVWESLIDIIGTSIDIMESTKGGRHRDGRVITKIVLTSAPEAADIIFGNGVPVNFGFKPQMPINQRSMLEAALGQNQRFDLRQYDLSRLPLDSALKHGITHAIQGAIRGTYIDANTGDTTIVFSLKLIDIYDNNRIVSDQNRIAVHVNGYSEPDSYESALIEAVNQFCATF